MEQGSFSFQAGLFLRNLAKAIALAAGAAKTGVRCTKNVQNEPKWP